MGGLDDDKSAKAGDCLKVKEAKSSTPLHRFIFCSVSLYRFRFCSVFALNEDVLLLEGFPGLVDPGRDRDPKNQPWGELGEHIFKVSSEKETNRGRSVLSGTGEISPKGIEIVNE